MLRLINNQRPILLPATQICTIPTSELQSLQEITAKILPIPAVSVNALSKEAYLELLHEALQELSTGRLRKVVLSRVEKVETTTFDYIRHFLRMVQKYPTAMCYCWYHPKVGLWLGATPETLVHIQNNMLSTMALAGTQPFKPQEEIVWGTKETEEQQLVEIAITEGLQLITNNIATKGPYTHKAGDLIHLRTDIQAPLFEYSLKRILQILHPTPAVCGLPRTEAKQFITTNEQYNRTFYTGFMGELNISGTKHMNSSGGEALQTSASLFVNLRCMQLQKNTVLVYVGGGITKDSDPEKEWMETVAKTKTIKAIL